MNETIGVKGGKNDRRRSLQITKAHKKKLTIYQQEQQEKDFEKLEKSVSINQGITLIKILPIVLIGQIYQSLTEDSEKTKRQTLNEVITRIENEDSLSAQEKKEVIVALSNYDIFSLDDDLLGKLGLNRETSKQVSEFDLTDFTGGKELNSTDNYSEIDEIDSDKQLISSSTKKYLLEAIETKPITNQNKEIIATEDNDIVFQESPSLTENTPNSFTDQLDKVKNHKIVSEYEHKLKDVRKELRQLIFEYNIIADTSEKLYDSHEAEELLDRLNSIIKKVEELKMALTNPNIDKYDDNYIYTLIADYMESFNNQNFVSEIKDSSLYIMISNKLNELDSKKDKLQDKIEARKKTLELDEEHLDMLREKYYDFAKFNKELLNFQLTQDKVLDDINRKMAEATTIKDRVEVQVQGMSRQSRRLMTLLAASMILPGARSARSVATMTATYLYFMRNVMRPHTVTRRYKVVNTTNYHKEIEHSLEQLDDVSTLLTKTSRQLARTIKEVESEFSEYMLIIPECKELLQNLEKVRDEIKEKEYELDRIKDEQVKNLEKNNAKVKELNYEMAM